MLGAIQPSCWRFLPIWKGFCHNRGLRQVIARIGNLNDAFTTLLTARRIANGTDRVFGDRAPISSASAWKCGPDNRRVFRAMENFLAIFPRYGK